MCPRPQCLTSTFHQWTFRNKRDGKYLAVEGNQAGDNKSVIGQEYVSHNAPHTSLG